MRMTYSAPRCPQTALCSCGWVPLLDSCCLVPLLLLPFLAELQDTTPAKHVCIPAPCQLPTKRRPTPFENQCWWRGCASWALLVTVKTQRKHGPCSTPHQHHMGSRDVGSLAVRCSKGCWWSERIHMRKPNMASWCFVNSPDGSWPWFCLVSFPHSESKSRGARYSGPLCFFKVQSISESCILFSNRSWEQKGIPAKQPTPFKK